MSEGQFSPFLLFFIFAALVVALIIVGVIKAAKRREAWRQLAQRLGCSFSPRAPFSIAHSYPHSLFRQGHGRRAYNVLYGEIEGRELKVFDYIYKTRSGTGKQRSEQTHYHTCLLLTAPIPFETLSIRPETFLDRVGEFFGLDDIDFESDQFSRRFFVKCNNKRFAYDVIHARTMELLLECGRIYVEARANLLLFYYTRLLRVPGEVEQLIRHGLRFIELIPNYLLEEKVRSRSP